MATGLPRALVLTDEDVRSLSFVVDDLVKRLGSTESARIIGLHYLSEHPEEADKSYLLERLGLNEDTYRSSDKRYSSVIDPKSISQRIRQDFDSGRMARLNGWFLSQTEVRLCALIWLLPVG